MDQAIRVTEALIKFITDHNGHVDDDLQACLLELKAGSRENALDFARKVKPHGMGGISDWWPKTINKLETGEYNEIMLLALVNYWCQVIHAMNK
jgi:hypothetical protein